MKHLVIAAVIVAGSPANAAISINLSGNTESAGWRQLKASNPYWAANGYPTSYPGSAAWPAPVAANAAGSNSGAVLMKESGNGYFAGSSLYDAGAPGTFSVSDDAPLVNISTIILQVDAGTSVGALPVLSYNGGSQALSANYFSQSDGDYLSFDFTSGQSFPSRNHAWQWDLTGLGVSSYKITWGSLANDHLTQYEVNLTAGDTFSQVVPEPSALVLFSLTSFALFRRRRR